MEVPDMSTILGWFKSSSSPVKLVCRGRLYSLTQHYIPALQSSAACLSPSPCVLCDKVMPVQQCAALPVSEPESERVYLLRITPSQVELIAALQSRGNSLLGQVIEVSKPFKSSPWRLAVSFHGRVQSAEAPVEKYLSAIGKRAYAFLAEKLYADPTALS